MITRASEIDDRFLVESDAFTGLWNGSAVPPGIPRGFRRANHCCDPCGHASPDTNIT